MQGTRQPRVKICCISSEQEAQDAIRLGASALGLVGAMSSGPGMISDEAIQVFLKVAFSALFRTFLSLLNVLSKFTQYIE